MANVKSRDRLGKEYIKLTPLQLEGDLDLYENMKGVLLNFSNQHEDLIGESY